MKALGKYVRECCGRRLPGRYEFCPLCGTKADRPVTSEASLILIEIDRRARLCESKAQKAREQLTRIDAGEQKLPDWAPSRKSLEKCVASYAKAGLWYRAVERLISDLSQRPA